jgi:hypothetical protein
VTEPADAEALGSELARRLVEEGGDALLAQAGVR